MENTYFAAGSNLAWSQCCRARLFLKPLAHLLWAQIRARSFPLDCSVSESFVTAAVALAYPLRPPESRHYLFICVCERLTDQTWLRAQAAPSEGAAGWRPAPAASATATGSLGEQRRLGHSESVLVSVTLKTLRANTAGFASFRIFLHGKAERPFINQLPVLPTQAERDR